jgi:hypothetical protein
MDVDPSTVDGSAVVAPAAGTQALPLEQGWALLDQGIGAYLVVNPTGLLVWQCLDGTSSLADICRDLADVLDAPFETVLADTVAVVRQMAERDLLRTPDADAAGRATRRMPRPDHATVARREFAPDPWGALAVEVDGRRRALAVGDSTLHELARAAIASDRLVAPPDPPDLWLRVAPARGTIPGMHALYHDGRCVLRATGEGRMLRAALLHLAAAAPAPEGTARLRGRVVVGADDRIVVFVGVNLELLDHLGPRIGNLGGRVLDGPGPLVDVDTLAVVVPPLPDFLDRAGLAALDARLPRAPSERPVDPGRYELRQLVVVGLFGPDDRPRDPAVIAEALLPFTDDRTALAARIAEQVESRWSYGRDDREMIEIVDSLVGGR